MAMTKEKLDALLQSGAITQEEYDAFAKTANLEKSPESTPDKSQEQTKDDTQEEALTREQVEELISRAVGKATYKLGNEKKRLKEELERVKKAHMTDEEQQAAALKEREDDLAERERELREKENRLYAIKANKSSGLDAGSDRSLALVDFWLGEDETAIDSRVKAFDALVKRFVKAEVDKTFKANGRTPEKGAPVPSGENPWAKGAENITKQMQIEMQNPDLAKQLKAQAGVI